MQRVKSNLVLALVFLFFALGEATMLFLQASVKVITQTKHMKLDSVIGSIGALSYVLMGLLLLLSALALLIDFAMNRHRSSAIYCIKLIVAELSGVAVAMLISKGI